MNAIKTSVQDLIDAARARGQQTAAAAQADQAAIDAEAKAEEKARQQKQIDELVARNVIPAWAAEFASVVVGYDYRWLSVRLAGCAPIRWDMDAQYFSVSEPQSVAYMRSPDGWYVDYRPCFLEAKPTKDTFDEAVYLAAQFGESWDAMELEAARRNERGDTPELLAVQDAPAPAEIDAIDQSMFLLQKFTGGESLIADGARDDDGVALLASVGIAIAMELRRITEQLEARRYE